MNVDCKDSSSVALYSPLTADCVGDDVDVDADYDVEDRGLSKQEELPERKPSIVQTLEDLLLNKAGSFSCYVCLANTIMGAGMLGLPYAFSQAGWALGTFMMCFCAASSAFSLHELSICAAKTTKPSSFYSVAMLAAPSYVWLIDFAVAIKCFGVATSYLIIVGDLMPEAMEQMGAAGRFQNRLLWIGIVGGIVGPIAFLNSLEALKFTSTFSVLFVGFLATIIVLFAIPATGLDACGGHDPDEACVGPKFAINPKPMGALPVLSIFVFAFTCHQNTFPVVNELRNPTQPRVNAVLFAAIASALSVFMVVNIAGFVTYGDAVESNVLMSYPKIPLTTVARVCITLLVAFTYPLQCNPARRSILNIWRFVVDGAKETSPADYKSRYMIVTSVFLAASFMIAFTLTDLGVMLSIVGATGSTIVSYILPGGFYYSLHRDDPDAPRWKVSLSLAQFCLGCCIIPMCLTFIFMGAGAGE